MNIYTKELIEFVKLSKYAGERFDLCQAGGGNSSVKTSDGLMYIKSSGCLLSAVERDCGFSIINNNSFLENLDDIFTDETKCISEKDIIVTKLLKKSCLNNAVPSIETILHSYSNKYSLHIHPLALNTALCSCKYKEILEKAFHNPIIIDYKTPGIELGLEIKKYFEDSQGKKVLFLQNHGIFVSANTLEKVFELMEDTVSCIEKSLGLDFSDYKFTNNLSYLYNSIENDYKIAYLSEDKIISDFLQKNKELFFINPICPDKQVYCGQNPMEIHNFNDVSPFIEHKRIFGELPKIIIYRNLVFIIANNVRKAKEIEDVLKSDLLVLKNLGVNISCLNQENIDFIKNWEKEKYRQNI